MDDLLTTAEAAQYLKVSVKALQAMVRAGQIPVRRYGVKGKLWRFLRRDLLAPLVTDQSVTVMMLPDVRQSVSAQLRKVRGGLRYR